MAPVVWKTWWNTSCVSINLHWYWGNIRKQGMAGLAHNGMLRPHINTIWRCFSYYWCFVRGIHWSPLDLKWSVMQNCDVLYVVSLNKMLNKQLSQSWCKYPQRYYQHFWKLISSKDVVVCKYQWLKTPLSEYDHICCQQCTYTADSFELLDIRVSADPLLTRFGSYIYTCIYICKGSVHYSRKCRDYVYVKWESTEEYKALFETRK